MYEQRCRGAPTDEKLMQQLLAELPKLNAPSFLRKVRIYLRKMRKIRLCPPAQGSRKKFYTLPVRLLKAGQKALDMV